MPVVSQRASILHRFKRDLEPVLRRGLEGMSGRERTGKHGRGSKKTRRVGRDQDGLQPPQGRGIA